VLCGCSTCCMTPGCWRKYVPADFDTQHRLTSENAHDRCAASPHRGSAHFLFFRQAYLARDPRRAARQGRPDRDDLAPAGDGEPSFLGLHSGHVCATQMRVRWCALKCFVDALSAGLTGFFTPTGIVSPKHFCTHEVKKFPANSIRPGSSMRRAGGRAVAAPEEGGDRAPPANAHADVERS